MDTGGGAYGEFAEIYDEFMRDNPYDIWLELICSILCEHGITEGFIADLCCGTGQMAALMHDKGYEVCGVDISEEMLGQARRNCSGEISFIRADIKDFSLNKKAHACISVCDGFNYIMSAEKLYKTFENIKNNLVSDGLLIFDIKLDSYYENMLGNDIYADINDHGAYIWDNSYDPDTGMNTYILTFFKEQQDGLYKRYEETHVQRAYTREQIEEAAGISGFLLEGFDEYMSEMQEGRALCVLKKMSS